MEVLLERIIGNPVLLIILLALAKPVWGFIRGMAGAEKPAPMPSFGGAPGERRLPDAGRVAQESSPFLEEDERKAQLRESERKREAELRRQRLEGSGEGVTLEGGELPGRGGAGAPDIASVPHAPPGSSAAAPTVSLVPEKEDMLRAVVWSEVLGPPRAKKPYGRR